MQSRAPQGPGKFHVVVLVIIIIDNLFIINARQKSADGYLIG